MLSPRNKLRGKVVNKPCQASSALVHCHQQAQRLNRSSPSFVPLFPFEYHLFITLLWTHDIRWRGQNKSPFPGAIPIPLPNSTCQCCIPTALYCIHCRYKNVISGYISTVIAQNIMEDSKLSEKRLEGLCRINLLIHSMWMV